MLGVARRGRTAFGPATVVNAVLDLRLGLSPCKLRDTNGNVASVRWGGGGWGLRATPHEEGRRAPRRQPQSAPPDEVLPGDPPPALPRTPSAPHPMLHRV